MTDDAEPQVEVRRSTRRRKTVSARREGDRVVVLVPARLTAAEEARWVETMVQRLQRAESSGRRRRAGDVDLERRADELAREHLPPGVRPTSVRWVDTMTTRWASCTTTSGAIRLSDRLQGMPAWVVDHVLLHELAHLVHADHGREFWALVDALPGAERAKGFLDGVTHAERARQDRHD